MYSFYDYFFLYAIVKSKMKKGEATGCISRGIGSGKPRRRLSVCGTMENANYIILLCVSPCRLFSRMHLRVCSHLRSRLGDPEERANACCRERSDRMTMKQTQDRIQDNTREWRHGDVYTHYRERTLVRRRCTRSLCAGTFVVINYAAERRRFRRIRRGHGETYSGGHVEEVINVHKATKRPRRNAVGLNDEPREKN